MALTIADHLITSDRIDRFAWRSTVDGAPVWHTSWSATCYWTTRAEAETRMRYAEHVEADGPHPHVTDADVEAWSAAIDQWAPTTRVELRAGHLDDLTVGNGEVAQDLYEATAA